MSLDALRGFDMMFIMGVASLVVAVCSLFPGGEDCFLATQMSHVSWNGLQHHDTIFPLFMFLAGVSWPFSFQKQLDNGRTMRQVRFKIYRRALILVLLGLVYNGLFNLDWANLRCASVLGRIGLAWMFAALIYIFVKSPIKRGIIAAVILLGYYGLVRFVCAPDMPGSDPLSIDGNIVGWVDRCILPGKLLYNGGRFDPEGLLSTVPAIVTVMLGMFTSDFIRLPESRISGGRKTLWLLAAAVVMAGLAALWSLDFPINKKLWTSSFVLAVGAFSVASFALFYYIIDVRGWRKWCFPFRVIGMNSITIYLLQRIMPISAINRFFLGGLAGMLPEAWSKVLFAFGYVAICYLILLFLYKKKVFLKV